ncbi:MAG: hypothetical protein FWH36_02250 [Lentimicrobiaceae bacterium]|nr:hypothetical protein [Lentimicrobiaceae bacterium]
MDEQKQEQLAEETGSGFYYADLFIESAKQAVAEMGKRIPQRIIDEFYREVELGRKEREKRINW